jgi:transposase-like protein
VDVSEMQKKLAHIGFQGRALGGWCTLTTFCVPTHDRSPTVQVNSKNLLDAGQCYQTVRELRWPDGVAWPCCQSKYVIKRGLDDTEPARQRYECHDGDTRFDERTDTIFAGHHQPLTVWGLCLSFMGLHVSNEHMAHE